MQAASSRCAALCRDMKALGQAGSKTMWGRTREVPGGEPAANLALSSRGVTALHAYSKKGEVDAFGSPSENQQCGSR